MSARILLYCDRAWQYGICAATLLTDARSVAEARTAADAQGWNTRDGGPDHCPTCSGTRRVRPGTNVATLHPNEEN